MIFENLDQKDKEVISAMVNGVSDEDIKVQLEVDDAKLDQLRPVVDELLNPTNSAELGSSPVSTGNSDAQGTDTAAVQSSEQNTGISPEQVGTDASQNVETPADVVAPKHIVTQEDLDNNPHLVEEGLKVGDEIDAPVKAEVGTE